MGKEYGMISDGFAWLFLDRMWHKIISRPPNSLPHYITSSYSTRYPSQKLTSRCGHYSESFGIGQLLWLLLPCSFLIHFPSPFTLQALLSSLLEYCNCGCIGLPASDLLSPPISQPSQGHGDFLKQKAERVTPLFKTLHSFRQSLNSLEHHAPF